MGTLAVEARGNEVWAGECGATVPGELAGNEAGAEETVVVSPEGEGSVALLGAPQAAGASFEEWGADVAERFMSLT